MKCSRNWTRFARRFAVAGVAGGSLAAPGFGCRSADPSADPPAPARVTTLYPGLPPAPRTVASYPGLPSVPAQVSAPYPGQAPAAVSVSSGARAEGLRTSPILFAGAITPGSAHRVTAAGGIAPPETGGPPPRLVSDPVVGTAATVAASGAPVAPETLDLAVALRLAGVENPTINLARERIQEALADQLGARSILLPSINVGGNYHDHDGTQQSSSGFIRNLHSQSLFLGLGAVALGSSSPTVPGIRVLAHLGDAWFEPLAARQRVSARRSDARAVENDILLQVATAYLELTGAEARLDVLQKARADAGEVVRLTRVFAEKGAGRQADADRASARADLIRRAERAVEGDVAVASAHLCRLLSLDPSVRLRSPGGQVVPFRLISEDADTEELVAGALHARPEVSARTAEVTEAQYRVRQEKVRPLLPLLSVGYSGGLFGGGGSQVAQSFGPLKQRSDFDTVAVWNFQGLGFGNRAQVRRADAVMGESIARFDVAVNQIRREVTEAQADARAAYRQVGLTRVALSNAEEGYKLETERIKQGQGRPIEVLDSLQQLIDARLELVQAVITYDTAQFRLFVATGSTPDGTPAPLP